MKNKRIAKQCSILLATTLAISAMSFSGCGNKNEAVTTETIDYRDISLDIETRVDGLLAQMTIEEKIGQMIQAEQAAVTPEDVTNYGLGSILSGGGSAPSTGNTAKDWQTRVNELKTAAVETRLGIPLIYGVDAVHGNNNIYGSVIYPHNIALGAANDEDLMYEIGTAVAEEVRATGIQWDFAPCIGNPQDVSWGRTYECFSQKTEDISPLIVSYIQGLQDHNVIACAKHFIGEGYTEAGVNQGDVKMSADEFDALLKSGVLDPYTNAIDAGVMTVMASYNSVDGVKCHENYHLLTEVLKGELGFDGFVVSDYDAIEQTSGNTYVDQVEICVNAGIDMFMEPNDWKNCYDALIGLVKQGRVTEERINDAVRRILRVKMRAGLFEEEIGGETEQALLDNVGSVEHRELARRAVRESLVCLKNEAVGQETAINALSSATNITLCGKKAYDMGAQCGGWTITWQGQYGKITEGTTIIEGVYGAVQDHAHVSQTVNGTVTEGSDAVIVVIGEVPYAETDGDRKTGDVKISADDQEMLEILRPNLEALGENVPVIAIVVAGRPVDLSAYEDMFDGIVMAWLPGSEGEGIADVLFGNYDFSGKLTYDWGNYTYGFGLTKDGDSL